MIEFFNGIGARLQDIFDPNKLGIYAVDFVANLLIAVVVFLVFYALWLIINRFLRPILLRGNTDETTIAFFETILKYLVLGLGVIIALDAIGIQTAGIIASLGIAGLTIGFAAKDALSNLIAGLLIFFDRPFVIGDLVEIDDHYGTVEKITLRSTRIVTRDGKMLAVPNIEIINKTVASYTNFPNLRLDVAITIAPEEDINRTRRLLLSIVEDDSDYLDKPPPRVVVTEVNDYNITVELQAWLRDERQHIEKRFDLREKMFELLMRENIDMPYETIRYVPVDIPADGEVFLPPS